MQRRQQPPGLCAARSLMQSDRAWTCDPVIRMAAMGSLEACDAEVRMGRNVPGGFVVTKGGGADCSRTRAWSACLAAADWEEYAMSPLEASSSAAASMAETFSPGASNDSATPASEDGGGMQQLQQVPETFDSVETTTSDVGAVQRDACDVLLEDEDEDAGEKPEKHAASQPSVPDLLRPTAATIYG